MKMFSGSDGGGAMVPSSCKEDAKGHVETVDRVLARYRKR